MREDVKRSLKQRLADSLSDDYVQGIIVAQHPIIVREERDRPQPKFDVNVEHGMATVVRRVRPCPVLQFKYTALSHNTIRGAAGAALLNAELMKSEGYLD